MTRSIRFLGVRLDAVSTGEAVSQILAWAGQGHEVCRFVVTPNTDHIVMLQAHEGLRRAYRHAALRLADGFPVVWGARLVGHSVPERVAGSDLVPAVCAEATRRFSSRLAERKLRTFLLGAAPGVADRAAATIRHLWPGVEPVGAYSPPLGFERDPAENERILALIEAARPDLLIVGLGAPKQELWVDAQRRHIRAAVAICAGATIDFLAGNRQRAPRWMQKGGLEWLHRLWGDPRRLLWRYARDAAIFPLLLAKEMAGRLAYRSLVRVWRRSTAGRGS